MKIIKEDGALIIKSWCENPDEKSIEQARNLARLPFAFKQICLMPDTHVGYGMPIGGVMAASDAIVPNAVGVDIGCGMCAVRTSLTELDRDTLKCILGTIRSQIPLGFGKHKQPQDNSLMPSSPFGPVVEREYENAQKSLGTLGGGNHFIEIQKGNDGHIWIMVHSGSRNLGKQVADFYNKKAIEINEKHFSLVPKAWQLAFLPFDSMEGQIYLTEMKYCVDFALANRRVMMDRITGVFRKAAGDVYFDPMINIAHNYAVMEHHFGRDVLIHRKGATSARADEIGIIPGSQGSSSYIVKGKGSAESFMSCSHGAGRRLGRKQAEATLDFAEEKKRLEDKGILHALRGKSDLEEAAGAYKDIDTVMAEQTDLVEIVVKLEPLAVVKG